MDSGRSGRTSPEELAGVEQGQLEPMKHRRQVLTGRRHSALPVGVQQRGSGLDELAVADMIRRHPGDRGDLGQGIPLCCDVGLGGIEVGADLAGPAMRGRAEQPSRVAQMQVQLADQTGRGVDLAGHHQPRPEGPRLGCDGDLLRLGQLVPTAAAADPGLCGPGRHGGRSTGPPTHRAHRCQITGDQVGVTAGQVERGRHHGTSTA
jgi:hypothetical protein